MIPKIVHYCWFGENELGETEKKNIADWKKLLPDYQIIEWNESNFNVLENGNYVKEAYENKKWAFVSDFARLKALYEYGGIYLDTDVELIKSFDELLFQESFIGAESKYSMCTATIGASKESPFIADLLSIYKGRHFMIHGKIDKTPNSKLIFEKLISEYNYKYSETEIANLSNVTIYPQDYFSPINCYTMRENRTNNTFSIHRYASTWKSPKERFKDKIMASATRILGEDTRDKLKKIIKG